jgi:hypothetical protein
MNKSKLEIAKEWRRKLFGDIGVGGSIDTMNTSNMVEIIIASDLYKEWHRRHLKSISRSTIERALGRRDI